MSECPECKWEDAGVPIRHADTCSRMPKCKCGKVAKGQDPDGSFTCYTCPLPTRSDMVPISGSVKCAAVSYIEREDGRLLCVWNQRYGGWSLPGGMVEPGETIEKAMVRELKEETGCEVFSASRLYEGPHGIKNEDNSRASMVYIYRVRVRKTGEPREMEVGCPVTWLTRAQFLKWSPFAPFYEKVFAAVPPGVT